MTRSDANAILSLIGAESLTDEEWESMNIDEDSNNKDMYDALSAVLAERSGVDGMQARLNAYYTAKGIDVGQSPAVGKSNIFVGSVL